MELICCFLHGRKSFKPNEKKIIVSGTNVQPVGHILSTSEKSKMKDNIKVKNYLSYNPIQTWKPYSISLYCPK